MGGSRFRRRVLLPPPLQRAPLPKWNRGASTVGADVLRSFVGNEGTTSFLDERGAFSPSSDPAARAVLDEVLFNAVTLPALGKFMGRKSGFLRQGSGGEGRESSSIMSKEWLAMPWVATSPLRRCCYPRHSLLHFRGRNGVIPTVVSFFIPEGGTKNVRGSS